MFIYKFPEAYRNRPDLLKKVSNIDAYYKRPANILPGMSKIFEREMVNQLYAQFDNIFS